MQIRTLRKLTLPVVLLLTFQFSTAYASVTTTSSTTTMTPTTSASTAPQPTASTAPSTSTTSTTTSFMTSGPLSAAQPTTSSSPAPTLPTTNPSSGPTGTGTTTEILSRYPNGAVQQQRVTTTMRNGNQTDTSTVLMTLNQTGGMTAVSGTRTVSDFIRDAQTGETTYSDSKTYDIYGVPAGNGTVTSAERMTMHSYLVKEYSQIGNRRLPTREESWTETFFYNPASSKKVGFKTTYAYDANGRQTNYDYIDWQYSGARQERHNSTTRTGNHTLEKNETMIYDPAGRKVEHSGTVTESDFNLDARGRRIWAVTTVSQIMAVRNNAGVVTNTYNREVVESLMQKDYISLDSELMTADVDWSETIGYDQYSIPHRTREGYQDLNTYSGGRLVHSEMTIWNGDGSYSVHLNEEIAGGGNQHTTRNINTEYDAQGQKTHESGFEMETNYQLDPQTYAVTMSESYWRDIIWDPSTNDSVTRLASHTYMESRPGHYESWTETYSYPSPTSGPFTGTPRKVGYLMEYTTSPYTFHMITWLWDGTVIDVTYTMPYMMP